VIDFEPTMGEAAVEMYGARADKEWGVIDCLSFVVMKQRALEAALTFDHHFEQAGFTALLLQPPASGIVIPLTPSRTAPAR
jgi:predicted nucleic acid-binding protein